MPSVLARPLLVGGLVLAPWALATSETCGGEELTSLLQGGLRSVKRHEANSTGAAFGLPEQAVACGQSHFAPYPDYSGNLVVTGSVHVTAIRGHSASKHRQVLAYHISGADPRCDHGPRDHHGSCEIHIHTGTTCEAPGMHYWDNTVRSKDPWHCVTYTSEQKKESGPWEACSFGVSATTGIPPEDVPGHAVVVHDYDGNKVACTTIPEAPKAAPAAPLASEPSPADHSGVVRLTADSFTTCGAYDGAVQGVNVAGTVLITPTKGHCPKTPGQYLTYNLTGLDPRCSKGPGDTKNSCGVHVHAGTSCADKDQLGHYWSHYNDDSTDPHSRKKDPWLCTAYTSCDEGRAAEMLVEVTTGVSFESIAGKAFIVHDFDGKRMACGMIH